MAKQKDEKTNVMRALERKDVVQAALIAAVKAQMEVSHERKD